MQVLKELNRYYNFLNNTIYAKRPNCVFNSLAFISHTNFKYDLVIVTGHTICANSDTIVDPTVGCGWFYHGSLSAKVKDILKNLTEPDFKTDWFLDKNFTQWWDYTFKYNRNVKAGTVIPGKIPIQVTRAAMECKEITDIGEFLEYVRV